MASIRTAGLTKDFGDLRAVNEIDLDLPEGGVAGFVGPNGAGKSTTIRMLLGLITPTGGEGEVFGHPIGRPAAYLHRVGALIEAPAFYPALTGEANLTELTAGRRRAGTALPRHHRRLPTMARTHLIAEQVRRIESDPALTAHLTADSDATAALIHMRDVLEDVIGSRTTLTWQHRVSTEVR